MKLWLQRHATVQAAPGLCYGRLDVPDEPADTEAAAQALAPRLPAGLAVWRSPRSRCQHLAEALAARRPDLAPARVDMRLAEIDFGDWEGRPWAQIDPAEVADWTAGFVHRNAGQTGECAQRFLDRVAAAWDDWLASGADALWITHAGVMRGVELVQRGHRQLRSAEDWPTTPLDFAACVCVEVAADAGGDQDAAKDAD